MRKFLGHWLIALSLLLPIPALAQTAVTMRAVNVRTGPDPAFPLVTRLQARTPVHDEEFQATVSVSTLQREALFELDALGFG